jgi:hypothetical protein
LGCGRSIVGRSRVENWHVESGGFIYASLAQTSTSKGFFHFSRRFQAGGAHIEQSIQVFETIAANRRWERHDRCLSEGGGFPLRHR